MAFKYKINSLRCKKWFGFAKQKLGVWKAAGLFIKNYVVDGYKITLKPETDLAIITAPPGIVYFTRFLREYRMYYADMFGRGKEKPAEIAPLKWSSGQTITPQKDGWDGNLLVLNTGADYMRLKCVYTPMEDAPEDAYFPYRVCWDMDVIPAAPYAVISNSVSGGGYISLPKELLRIQTYVFTDPWWTTLYTSETTYVDSSERYIHFAWGKTTPNNQELWAYIFSITDNTNGYPALWPFFPEGDSWSYATVPYAYAWPEYSALADRYVVKAVFSIYTETPGLNRANPYWLFMQFDFEADPPYDILLLGYTSGETLFALDEDNIPATIEDDVVIEYFNGYPGSLAPTHLYVRTIYFPLGDGDLAMFHYDLSHNPVEPIKLVINQYDSPYINPGLTVPYDPDIYAWDEQNWVFPVVSLANPADGVYLYWEEYCLYGDVVARVFPMKIVRFKYGSPYASWIDFPTPPGELTGFTPIKISWDHRIVLASVYINDPQNGGTFAAILDTALDNDWVLGERISADRLDRTTPAIFGDHPYVQERIKYGGTQWAWDYTVCDNYPS